MTVSSTYVRHVYIVAICDQCGAKAEHYGTTEKEMPPNWQIATLGVYAQEGASRRCFCSEVCEKTFVIGKVEEAWQ